jgi:hypothetical protein
VPRRWDSGTLGVAYLDGSWGQDEDFVDERRGCPAIQIYEDVWSVIVDGKGCSRVGKS